MAQAATQAGQPESMEEILQSIKRIIEDDDPDNKPAAAAPAAADVLELTQVVKVEAEETALPPLPQASKKTPSAPPQDVVKSIDAIFAAAPKPEASAAPEPAIMPAPAPVFNPMMMEDGLVSEEAAQAAAAALKPIVESAQKGPSVPHIPSPALRSGNTVEDLILESLRPMLKAWLDEHLPTIVQKIVEKEVKRIVTFHQD